MDEINLTTPSKPWFEKMHDSAWYEFFYYILHYAWKHSEYWRGRITWNLIFSIIADDRFIKSSAYINDTARTLLAIGSGQHPGFAPAINNISGPIEGIQNVYKNIYGLNKYPPVVVHLERFNMKDTANRPVYYPLQYPTAIELGKKNRVRDSLITDLHEIRSALIQYKRDIMSDKFNITGTALEKLFHVVEYSYFHNNVDLHTGMQNSSMMAKEDPHLLQLVNDESYGVFPEMCSFVKGCIRISRKIDI